MTDLLYFILCAPWFFWMIFVEIRLFKEFCEYWSQWGKIDEKKDR